MTSQHDKAKRWQFSLGQLFTVTTGVAVLLAFWPLFAIGLLTVIAVAIGLVFSVFHLWYAFAIGAVAGVAITRAVVMIGRWLDSREHNL